MNIPPSGVDELSSLVFRYFDKDGDGLWNWDEFSAAVRVTEGREVAYEEYSDLCRGMPGLPEEEVVAQYREDPQALVRDAVTLRGLEVPPTSPDFTTFHTCMEASVHLKMFSPLRRSPSPEIVAIPFTLGRVSPAPPDGRVSPPPPPVSEATCSLYKIPLPTSEVPQHDTVPNRINEVPVTPYPQHVHEPPSEYGHQSPSISEVPIGIREPQYNKIPLPISEVVPVTPHPQQVHEPPSEYRHQSPSIGIHEPLYNKIPSEAPQQVHDTAPNRINEVPVTPYPQQVHEPPSEYRHQSPSIGIRKIPRHQSMSEVPVAAYTEQVYEPPLECERSPSQVVVYNQSPDEKVEATSQQRTLTPPRKEYRRIPTPPRKVYRKIPPPQHPKVHRKIPPPEQPLNVVGKLRQFEELRNAGGLTEGEFKEGKAGVLPAPVVRRVVTPSMGAPVYNSGLKSFRTRLINFYECYRPSKLPSVGPTLAQFNGREEFIFSTLTAKYGPEPPIDILTRPLPPDWSQVESPAGDIFYLYHPTNAKSWKRPPPP